jgi:hypothetical protein
MRARDFLQENDDSKNVTINIPITITFPAGGGMPSFGTNHTIAAPAGKELPDDPVYVSPLQQELELKKQQGGKTSKVINQIVSDDGAESTLGDDKNYFDLSENYNELQHHFDQLVEDTEYTDPE